MPTDTELDQVLVIAKKIHQSPVENKSEYFADVYSNFKKKFPMLYEMACSEHFDINHLEYMIRSAKNVNAGQVTHEDASKQVGQTMFDHFVGPALANARESDIKQ